MRRGSSRVRRWCGSTKPVSSEVAAVAVQKENAGDVVKSSHCPTLRHLQWIVPLSSRQNRPCGLQSANRVHVPEWHCTTRCEVSALT